MQDKLTILGNGTSSLVAAIALSNLGIPVDVFSNYPKENDTNLVTFLSTNSLNYLNSIGLDQLSKINNEPINDIECFYINKTNNKKTSLFFSDHKVKPLGTIIANNDLYKILYDQITEIEHIRIITDEILGITFDHPHTNLKMATGETYTAKIIIVTDSQNKCIQKSSTLKLITKDFNQIALSIDAGVMRNSKHTAFQYFTKDGPLALLPINNLRSSFVWSLQNDSEILQYSKKQLETEISKYINLHANNLSINSINQHKLVFNFSKNMTYQNMIFLGESAHKIHPLAGQGFNLTIKDIQTLQSTLSKYASLGYELNHEFIFEDFSNKRLPDNALSSFSTMFMSDYFFSNNPIVNKSIEASFKTLNKVPFIKRKIMMAATGKKVF